MNKLSNHLFFVCPTDELEVVINASFKEQNHFIASPSNSISFGPKNIADINLLIREHHITCISFVLADDNQIAGNGIHEKRLSSDKTLRKLDSKLCEQAAHAQSMWQTYDACFMRLSYHLNAKINELKYLLCLAHPVAPSISGQIYCRGKAKFTSIYSCLICNEFRSCN